MFDEQVVRRDPRVADLMDKFVCVRMVQGNGMDLTLFQFDYDLTFAAFFMNSDRTIYGRFGSRSDHDNAEKDISIEGFRQAMLAALDLHRPHRACALREHLIRDHLRQRLQDRHRHEHPHYVPRVHRRGTNVAAELRARH